MKYLFSLFYLYLIKTRLCACNIFLFVTFLAAPKTLFSLTKNEINIENWKNPSINDYLKIQKILSKNANNNIHNIFDEYRAERLRKVKIIDESFEKTPSLHIIPMGVSNHNRDVCIITYGSANLPYSYSPYALLKSLRLLNYKGHFIFQVGGCPNLTENSLSYVDTPYSFKVNMFREAIRLGFRYIIWFDSMLSITSKSTLENVISKTKKRGAFFIKFPLDLHCFRDHLEHYLINQKDISNSLNCYLHSLDNYIHINAKIIGLNMFFKKNSQIISHWQSAAKEKTSFMTTTPEEIPLSLIVRKIKPSCFIADFNWIDKHFPAGKR